MSSRRLVIMLLALFAPELIVAWAAQQFLSAREAAKNFNDTFGAQGVHGHGNHQMEEEGTELVLESPRSQERNSPSTSPPLAEAIIAHAHDDHQDVEEEGTTDSLLLETPRSHERNGPITDPPQVEVVIAHAQGDRQNMEEEGTPRPQERISPSTSAPKAEAVKFTS